MEEIKNLTEGPFSLFVIFTASTSVFLALTAIETFRQGPLPKIFLYTLITWTSYISAHKIVEGRFVDGKDPEKDTDERMTPKDLAEDTGFLTGTAFFAAGMTIGAYGLNISNPLVTVTGGLSFNFGYILAHWSTTGKLL